MDYFNSDVKLVNEYINKFDELFKRGIKRELIIYCTESISMNDPAHHLGHVYDVCKLGIQIADNMKFTPRQKELVILACLFHDLGCRFERKFHHLIGYGLTYEILHRFCRGEYSDEEILTIATAVLEHRSSNKEKPSTIISEVVSIADSGNPDIHTYIKRCIQFRLHRGDYTPGDNNIIFLQEVKDHLHEKFGVNGYHWKSYPDIGLKFFHQEWSNFKYYLQPENEYTFNTLILNQFKAITKTE